MRSTTDEKALVSCLDLREAAGSSSIILDRGTLTTSLDFKPTSGMACDSRDAGNTQTEAHDPGGWSPTRETDPLRQKSRGLQQPNRRVNLIIPSQPAGA